MNNRDFAQIITTIRIIMDKNKDYLTQLDQQNGDGDLGISMSAGYHAISDFLNNTDETDLGILCMSLSVVFNETAPSTLGTIFSLFFIGIAKMLTGKTEANTMEFASAMENGIAHIMRKANSKLGEKTILDSLIPGIQALKDNAHLGEKKATNLAAFAAAQGSKRTRAMMSVHGRAAYYREKSIGVLDGGAVAGALFFEGLKEFYRNK